MGLRNLFHCHPTFADRKPCRRSFSPPAKICLDIFRSPICSSALVPLHRTICTPLMLTYKPSHTTPPIKDNRPTYLIHLSRSSSPFPPNSNYSICRIPKLSSKAFQSSVLSMTKRARFWTKMQQLFLPCCIVHSMRSAKTFCNAGTSAKLSWIKESCQTSCRRLSTSVTTMHGKVPRQHQD